MQFSKSTDYALHALAYLAHLNPTGPTGIKELADVLNVSESYLSKIMTNLRKDGLVNAVPGAKGGYELAREASRISFLDVILAMEGRQHLFECSNTTSKQHNMLVQETPASECRIKRVMDAAETQFYDYLSNQSIQSVISQ